MEQGSEDYARVSDMRHLDDGRYVVEYMRLYTREEIEKELQKDPVLPECFQEHLDQRWPTHAHYKFILNGGHSI
jgi:hypothetical protein